MVCGFCIRYESFYDDHDDDSQAENVSLATSHLWGAQYQVGSTVVPVSHRRGGQDFFRTVHM